MVSCPHALAPTIAVADTATYYMYRDDAGQAHFVGDARQIPPGAREVREVELERSAPRKRTPAQADDSGALGWLRAQTAAAAAPGDSERWPAGLAACAGLCLLLAMLLSEHRRLWLRLAMTLVVLAGSLAVARGSRVAEIKDQVHNALERARAGNQAAVDRASQVGEHGIEVPKGR